jgi:hypothetical protein
MLDRRHAAFGRDALRSLWLCGSWHNWAMVGLLALFLSLPYLASFLPVLGQFATLIGIVLSLLTAALFAAYFLEIIPATASGEDELPDYPDASNWRDSVAEPLMSLICTVVALITPWLVWRLVSPHLGVSDATASAVTWTLGLAGFGLVPIGFVATAWGGVGMLSRVDLLLRAVWRTPLEYLSLLVMLALAIGAVGVLLFARVPTARLPDWLIWFATGGDLFTITLGGWRPAQVPVLAEFITVFAAILLARLIGLYQRHFGDRFPWA